MVTIYKMATTFFNGSGADDGEIIFGRSFIKPITLVKEIEMDYLPNSTANRIDEEKLNQLSNIFPQIERSNPRYK